ncbi:MAG: hypothetical protein GQ474_09750 [Sulfurimonas sp.]|nr:hypothetical protein [Sulfurimonas sp.]
MGIFDAVKNVVSPVTDFVGLTGQETPDFVNPEQIGKFTSPFGTSTKTGFESSIDDPNAALARSRLGSQLGSIGTTVGGVAAPTVDQSSLQADPARLAELQAANLAELTAASDPAIQARNQQAALQSALGGTAGSSTDLLRQQLLNQDADRIRQSNVNQSIAAREGLANQLFGQNLAASQNRFGQELGAGQFQLGQQQAEFGQNAALAQLFQGVGQQDFQNQLNAFGATQGALQGSQAQANALAQQLNQQEAARTAASNAAKTAGFQNLIGAGATGLGAFTAFGGKLPQPFAPTPQA